MERHTGPGISCASLKISQFRVSWPIITVSSLLLTGTSLNRLLHGLKNIILCPDAFIMSIIFSWKPLGSASRSQINSIVVFVLSASSFNVGRHSRTVCISLSGETRVVSGSLMDVVWSFPRRYNAVIWVRTLIATTLRRSLGTRLA